VALTRLDSKGWRVTSQGHYIGYMTRQLSSLKRSVRPFEWVGNQASVDFHNTASWRLDGSLPNERFEHYDDVLAWAVEAGVVGADVAESLHALGVESPGRAERALRDAHQLRALLHRVFYGVVDSASVNASDLAAFNARLGALDIALRRTDAASDGDAHVLAPKAVGGKLESVLWPVVWSAAQLLSSPERALLHGCANANCGWLFVDRSRRGNRRWCEMAGCGNRAKVQSYHQRRRAQ
jgi:predicted RNA-binding Zn ribbon-like protein